MAGRVPPPDFDIPRSDNVVGVRVIDSTARLRIPMASFVAERIPGHDFLECPAHVFLVEHASGQKLLFDLGMRKDLENIPPVIQALSRSAQEVGATATAETNVADILGEEGSVKLSDINAIVWSHWHVDHSGDPSTFPTTTSLVVGPGFKDILLPGYPANPEGLILESDYQGRELIELNFETHPGATKIGRFQAIDYFGDGSFYLLNAPGHTYGHIAALARTTPSTFILMGADSCHHGGSFRPTPHHPLPAELSPSPYASPPFRPGTVCPGEALLRAHPRRARDRPFYDAFSEAPDRSVADAAETRDKLIDWDARDDVFVVIAHDAAMLSLLDFFPKKLNDWKERGWKEESRWKFVADFKPET